MWKAMRHTYIWMFRLWVFSFIIVDAEDCSYWFEITANNISKIYYLALDLDQTAHLDGIYRPLYLIFIDACVLPWMQI